MTQAAETLVPVGEPVQGVQPFWRERDGMFVAKIGRKQIDGESLAELLSAVSFELTNREALLRGRDADGKTKTKAAEPVPVVVIRSDRAERALYRGKHGGHGKPLFTIDGRNVTGERYWRILRNLSDDELAAVNAALAREVAADKAVPRGEDPITVHGRFWSGCIRVFQPYISGGPEYALVPVVVSPAGELRAEVNGDVATAESVPVLCEKVAELAHPQRGQLGLNTHSGEPEVYQGQRWWSRCKLGIDRDEWLRARAEQDAADVAAVKLLAGLAFPG